MDRSALTRRGLITVTAVGLAGCLGSDDEEEVTDDWKTEDEPEQIDGNWKDSDEFREWLTDESAYSESHFFEFVAGYSKSLVSPRLEAFDLTGENVDGHLIQSGAEIHLGQFDAESIVSQFEDSDDHEVGDEHEGYTIVDEDVAVGDDAVLWYGMEGDLTRRIDVRTGAEDRLEAADPTFTDLFETLPDGSIVSGQYHSSEWDEFDIDELSLWGSSIESLESGEATWVFVFEDESEPTEDVLAELETVAEEVHDAELDEETAIVTGTVPDASDDLRDTLDDL